MRSKIIRILLPILCAALLGGCSQSRQVENQAYVIVLGVDLNEAGEITLTAKIPALSSSASEGAASKSASYLLFSASGDNFDAALEALHRASPRNLNLSQMQLLVVSHALASQARFRAIIEDIVQTERLFTASSIVICDEEAAEFIDALEPAVGSRLSPDITAILENYAEQGLIPVATLADVYYLTETMYSDPMAIRAHLSADDDEADITSYSKTTFSGGYIFQNGVLSMELSARECLLAALLRNEVKYFRYVIDGKSIEGAPNATAKLSVDTNQNTAILRAELWLNVGYQNDIPDVQKIERQLESDISDLIAKAQQNGAEPFGFSGVAAGRYLTIEKWLESDWRNRYKNADVDVKVRIALRDA